MSQKFQAAIHQRGDVFYVKLSGVIDEDNQLGELVDRIPAGTVVLDLGEIERINSCGVRDWVNWLGRIEKAGARVVLVECSPAIVAQINLVNNFTGAGVVKSFYAPYFCPSCNREKALLIEASELGSPPVKAPTCRCDECDSVMDFDDMEDSYFAFLTAARKVAEAALMPDTQELKSGEAEKSRIRSRIGMGAALGSTGSSLPSMSSLPSIVRATGSGVGGGSFAGAGGTTTGSRGLGGGFSRPGVTPGDGRAPWTAGGAKTPAAPHATRSGYWVYALIGALVVAVGVLAVLLLGIG